MSSNSERRWALAVRVLTLVSLILLIVAVLEAATLRRARAELQQVRSDRDRDRASVVAEWTRTSVDDVDGALRALDGFYTDVDEGLGRPGGLCARGRLDDRSIAMFVFGSYLPARAAGTSHDAALQQMIDTARAAGKPSR